MVQTPPHILVLIDLFALEVVILCHCAWADPEGGQGVETPILILIDVFALEVAILGHCAWQIQRGGQVVQTPSHHRLVCA